MRDFSKVSPFLPSCHTREHTWQLLMQIKKFLFGDSKFCFSSSIPGFWACGRKKRQLKHRWVFIPVFTQVGVFCSVGVCLVFLFYVKTWHISAIFFLGSWLESKGLRFWEFQYRLGCTEQRCLSPCPGAVVYFQTIPGVSFSLGSLASSTVRHKISPSA